MGTVFVGAGLQKLFLPEATQLPEPIITVGSLMELLCGAALVVGLFTRRVSIPLALLMLVDILVNHPPSGFVTGDEEFEHALVRLAASAALALAGPGKVALQR
jgi:putative oxidoreductase